MSAQQGFKFNRGSIELSRDYLWHGSPSHVERGKHPMHNGLDYRYQVGYDWINGKFPGNLCLKPKIGQIAQSKQPHCGRMCCKCWSPLTKFGPTSPYWSVDKWVLLSQQIRLKALAVMEQTCSQALYSKALCQSHRLLGLYMQYRHHWTQPIHTCGQTCRCPHTGIHAQMAHVFVEGKPYRQVVAGCSFVIQASSVIYPSEQIASSTSEAGDLLVTTVSNMSNVQLSLKDA